MCCRLKSKSADEGKTHESLALGSGRGLWEFKWRDSFPEPERNSGRRLPSKASVIAVPAAAAEARNRCKPRLPGTALRAWGQNPNNPVLANSPFSARKLCPFPSDPSLIDRASHRGG